MNFHDQIPGTSGASFGIKLCRMQLHLVGQFYILVQKFSRDFPIQYPVFLIEISRQLR